MCVILHIGLGDFHKRSFFLICYFNMILLLYNNPFSFVKFLQSNFSGLKVIPSKYHYAL